MASLPSSAHRGAGVAHWAHREWASSTFEVSDGQWAVGKYDPRNVANCEYDPAHRIAWSLVGLGRTVTANVSACPCRTWGQNRGMSNGIIMRTAKALCHAQQETWIIRILLLLALTSSCRKNTSCLWRRAYESYFSPTSIAVLSEKGILSHSTRSRLRLPAVGTVQGCSSAQIPSRRDSLPANIETRNVCFVQSKLDSRC